MIIFRLKKGTGPLPVLPVGLLLLFFEAHGHMSSMPALGDAAMVFCCLCLVVCCGLGFSGGGLSLPFILAASGSGFLKFAGSCLL